MLLLDSTSKYRLRSPATYLRTDLFAELPGHGCHGLNGRAQDKVDAMIEIIIIGMDVIEDVHPSIVITVIFT